MDTDSSQPSPEFSTLGFAQKWRFATAFANTFSRVLVWSLVLYLAVSVAPRLCAFVIQSGKPLSPLSHFSQVLTDWLRPNLTAVIGLLVVLSVGDLIARLLPPRGRVVRLFFLLWHFGSLWLPVLFAILYLNGLLWPLI